MFFFFSFSRFRKVAQHFRENIATRCHCWRDVSSYHGLYLGWIVLLVSWGKEHFTLSHPCPAAESNTAIQWCKGCHVDSVAQETYREHSMLLLHRFLKEEPLQNAPGCSHTSGGESYQTTWDWEVLPRMSPSNSGNKSMGETLFRNREADFFLPLKQTSVSL